jgi:hypothetical protein
MDANDNDVIDTNEYTSPVRTVQWIKASEVVASTSLTYPTPGDTTLTATVTLTPNLNEQQSMAAGDVKIGFTRPGSTATVAANATQNDTTRVWSATQSLITGNWVGMPNIAQVLSVADGADDYELTLDKTLGLSVGDLVAVQGLAQVDGTTAEADVTVAETTLMVTVDETDFANTTPATQAAAGGYVQALTALASATAIADKATYTTALAHGLSIGDLVTVTGGTGNATSNLARTAITSVPTALTFTIENDAITVGAIGGAPLVTFVSYIEAVAGSYSAKAQTLSTALGNTATNFAVATSSDDVTLATTATTNVQGASNDEEAADITANIRKGELSVELTATVLDVNDVAVTAGRPVVVSLGAAEVNGAQVGTFTINGTAYSSAVTLLTDANGKVVFTVGEDDGAVGSVTEVTVTPENLTGAQTADIELIWANVQYGIVDLNDSAALSNAGQNSITAGGSYAYSLSVLDQWKSAPVDGTHRVKYVTTGRTIATNYVAVANGAAAYTVADAAVAAATAIQTVFTLEELQTDATWNAGETITNAGNALTYTTSVVAATQVDAVLLDTNGSTAYGNATAALSAAATSVALAAQDRRITNLVKPTYGTEVIVSGRVSNATTNVPRAGAVVTLTGPNSILFNEGAVDAMGGVTIKTDENGEFSVQLISNTAQTNTVITVSSGADSETVKVSFTGAGASFGTSIVIDAPTSVDPGTSFKVTATLTDKNGNAVINTTSTSATVGRMLVTYTGPGITIAAMPTETDANGQVSFTVLLGTNDKGTGVVTVSYDQGDDGDFTGTTTADKDVIATKTVTVGAVAAVASATKVNVGSFKGFVALYAKGYEGKKMSAIVAGKWIVVASLASDFERVVRYTGAGYDIVTTIYIDGVMISTFNTTTK